MARQYLASSSKVKAASTPHQDELISCCSTLTLGATDTVEPLLSDPMSSEYLILLSTEHCNDTYTGIYGAGYLHFSCIQHNDCQ